MKTAITILIFIFTCAGQCFANISEQEYFEKAKALYKKCEEEKRKIDIAKNKKEYNSLEDKCDQEISYYLEKSGQHKDVGAKANLQKNKALDKQKQNHNTQADSSNVHNPETVKYKPDMNEYNKQKGLLSKSLGKNRGVHNISEPDQKAAQRNNFRR